MHATMHSERLRAARLGAPKDVGNAFQHHVSVQNGAEDLDSARPDV